MNEKCLEFFPLLGALLDGELPPGRDREVSEHAGACAVCRTERDSLRALKAGLARIVLPPPPARRRWTFAAAAAAGIVAALILFSIPAPLPELVALSSKLHDDYLDGRVTLRDLGLKASVPGAAYVGECACPPEMGAASPFVVYRKGDTPISLLVAEAEPRALPASARRSFEGREYWFFRADRNSAVVCRTGKLCHVWVARMDEPELVRTILATREGRALFEGERFTLSGIT